MGNEASRLANKTRQPSVELMQGQRRRRWPHIKTTLDERSCLLDWYWLIDTQPAVVCSELEAMSRAGRCSLLIVTLLNM